MDESRPRVRRVFISVAEDSADVHAASLVRVAAALLPDCRFYGLTGPRLRALGVETVFDMTAHAAMLAGAAKVIGRAWRALRAVQCCWSRSRPDAVVLLDSPELNLRLAARARKLGVPVIYYIAPQTWASREGRVRAMARDVDALACILPFEEAYFRARGVNARFVGHPLFEALARERADGARVSGLRSGDGPLLALLPGSRKHVIDTILPKQLGVLDRLRAFGTPARAAVSAIDADRGAHIRGLFKRLGSEVPIVESDNASLLTAADLVLVASGTATLHVAHYRKPMIVMYDVGSVLGPLYRRWGHWVVRAPHLSLVNTLARRRIVPEFMPSVGDLDIVARTARGLLADRPWRERVVASLDEVCRPLEGGAASRAVCALLCSALDRRLLTPARIDR
ncbi:MAG: hypothetical protein HRF50_14350 [Phycisphaerae bacterium]|jgi:lipid-A-disaccharide synthase